VSSADKAVKVSPEQIEIARLRAEVNCWDNAPTESFWARLKTASVHGQKFATCGQAKQAVMDWMAFYNHRRLHSTLGYVSPMQYEQRWYEAQREKAA